MPSAANLVRFFALSVAAISAMASPTSTSGFLPLNPELKSLVGREPEPYLSTNAQRMARGLPPKKPNFGVRRLAARQSPTACVASVGKIRADLDSPSSTGYVAATLNAFGEFTYTENPAEALEVSICFSDDAPFDIKTTNGGSTSYPYFGAVAGFANSDSNLSPSSLNYVYLAGASQTPAHSAPQNQPNSFTAATGLDRDTESAIWSIDSTTNVLSPHWVNMDGSVPQQFIRYSAGATSFLLTGSVAQFEATFGASQGAVLTFVPNAI